LSKFLPADAIGEGDQHDRVSRAMERDITPGSETPHDPETGEIIEGDAEVMDDDEPIDEPVRAKAAVQGRKKKADDEPPVEEEPPMAEPVDMF
jgi:hypothetical protein